MSHSDCHHSNNIHPKLNDIYLTISDIRKISKSDLFRATSYTDRDFYSLFSVFRFKRYFDILKQVMITLLQIIPELILLSYYVISSQQNC
jgi:hypothetical protein